MSVEIVSILWLSFQVSVLAVLLNFPLALFWGWFLAKHSFFGKSLLETFLTLPLVFPPVVTGYFLLLLFRKEGLGGQFLSWFGIELPYTFWAAVLAGAVVSFPLFYKAIHQSFCGISPHLEESASSLGLTPWQIFWKISFPLSKRGVIAGAVLSFIRSLGEFGATIFVAGNIAGKTQTIPLAIYSFEQVGGSLYEQKSQQLIFVCVMVSFLSILLANQLSKKKK